MPDIKDNLRHSRIKRATKDCACTLLDRFLDDRLNKLSETEVKKLHELASNWLFEKNLRVEAIRHTAAANDFQESVSYAPRATHFGATQVLSDISRGAIPLIDQLLNATLPEPHGDFQQAPSLEISPCGPKPALSPVVRHGKVAEIDTPYIESLSPREIEILKLLGRGLSMKGTARGLSISPGTVKWHVKNLYEKLGASSREDALCKARLRQLIH